MPGSGLFEKEKGAGVYLLVFWSLGWGHYWIVMVGTCLGDEGAGGARRLDEVGMEQRLDMDNGLFEKENAL